MNKVYKDMLEKIEHHKKIIYDFYIKKSYYPSKELVQEKINQLDNRVALFKAYIAVPGDLLDVNKINYCLESIYKDLEILFKVINKITIEDFNSLLLYVETHLCELESMSKELSQRTKEEINSTAFGDTIYFKSSNWNLDTKDETVIISLGDIDLIQDSKIACFSTIRNIDTKNTNIQFKFKATDKKFDFNCLPYNYNNNSYKVPGESSINDIEIKLNNNSMIDNIVKIGLEKNAINNKNLYKVLASKNKMHVINKETNNEVYMDIPTRDNPYVCPVGCYITFYTKDIEQLEYNFNTKPLHTNFSLSNGIIKGDRDINKVYIDAQQGLAFYVDYESEKGCVYANVEEADIEGNYLLYKSNLHSKDYLVREYIRTNITRYQATVEIESKDDIVLDLDSIYIKEVN